MAGFFFSSLVVPKIGSYVDSTKMFLSPFDFVLQRLRKDSNPEGAKHNKNHENSLFPSFQGAKLGKNT